MGGNGKEWEKWERMRKKWAKMGKNVRKNEGKRDKMGKKRRKNGEKCPKMGKNGGGE